MKTTGQPNPQNGSHKEYYKSGELLNERHYKDGQKTGEWIAYNVDGSLRNTNNYRPKNS